MPLRSTGADAMLVNSMNSKSSELVNPAACSAAVGLAGWYISSVTRKAAAGSTVAVPATSWSGSDQLLHRPVESCCRTRTRYVWPGTTADAGNCTSLSNVIRTGLCHVGLIWYSLGGG